VLGALHYRGLLENAAAQFLAQVDTLVRAKSAKLLAILLRVVSDVRQITPRTESTKFLSGSPGLADARSLPSATGPGRCGIQWEGSSIFVDAVRRKEALSSPLRDPSSHTARRPRVRTEVPDILSPGHCMQIRSIRGIELAFF
jgi:hypothetical protein